jgi:hypothetical protein
LSLLASFHPQAASCIRRLLSCADA